jgi:hypothetical protein
LPREKLHFGDIVSRVTAALAEPLVIAKLPNVFKRSREKKKGSVSLQSSEDRELKVVIYIYSNAIYAVRGPILEVGSHNMMTR